MTPDETTADRFRRLAGQFTERAAQVPDDAWDNPSPCEGWAARDVVGHMVEWMPAIVAGAGVELPVGPSVDDDPYGAWMNLVTWLQSLLDDPDVAGRSFVHGHLGEVTVESVISSTILGDVVLHTWDLARATGLDERLDPDMVHSMYEGLLPLDDVLRGSGHYGPKVEVPDDADEQTKLLAFVGRRVTPAA